MPASPSFLNYTPVALAFGTSGLRGLVSDITDLEAYVNIKGAVSYLKMTGDILPGTGIVVGGDLRPSTDRIMRAANQAIVDSGCSVENAGKIPTPALILHSITTHRAGVMVTGSHIPFDRNGIKINKSVGELLKSDEAGVIAQVAEIRFVEYAKTAETSLFDGSGMLKRPADLPSVDPAAEERYVGRYVHGFPRAGLKGTRVLVYEHSAVGRDIVGRILRELGADVMPAGRAETFIPIDTENVTDELLDRLESLVAAAEAKGQYPDVIVSTDGDSDRPLVAAVRAATDKKDGRRVQFLSGDLLGIVAAEYLRADAVAVPISANDAVERRMAEDRVPVEKTRIGSPYVVAAIDDLAKRGKFARIAGWEANGGFLLGSPVTLQETLPSLPTRDAALPILANLFAAASAGTSLPSLWSRLPARFGRSGLIDNVSPTSSQAIVAAMSVPEAPATLARFFTAALGFGRVMHVDTLDGARVYFDSGDVAHVRASGNAPQLRVYANAGSQERANQIVSLALAEPDGILRQLERAVIESTGRQT